jgi:hypothetical protein
MLSQISAGVPMRIATPEKCQRRKARYRVVDRQNPVPAAKA